MISRNFTKAIMGATALTIATVGAANAGGFAIREQSSTYQGASFAGAAAGGSSISSMFWNPATITQHHGKRAESHGAVIIGVTKINLTTAQFENPAVIPITGNPNSGDIAQDALVPSSYYSMQVSEKVWLGLGINAPFGLVTNPDGNWQGRFHALVSDVFTLNVNPVAAYKVSDEFSVAIGAQIQYLDARLSASIRNPGALVPQQIGRADLYGDDWQVGGTAGVTWTPNEYTTIGLGYRSPLKVKLEGNGVAVGAGIPGGQQSLGPISGEITLPEVVTLGIRHMVSEKTTLLGGVEWTNWSRFDRLDINFAAPPFPFPAQSLTTELWDDGWYFSLGAEHILHDGTVVRGGIGYEISPVPDATRTPRVPDNDRFWISLGVSRTINEWLDADLSYTHIFVQDAPINLQGFGENAQRGTIIGEAEAHADIISFAARIDIEKFMEAVRRGG